MSWETTCKGNLVVGVVSLPLPRENPLGMGGVMAKRYGELVHDLWNGSSKSVTPLKFRVSQLVWWLD